MLSPPAAGEQTFVLIAAGFSAALLVHHVARWLAARSQRVHLWVAIWAAGAFAWFLARLLGVQAGPDAPAAAARWAELAILSLVLMVVGSLGMVGNLRKPLLPDRFSGGALVVGALLVVGWTSLVGVPGGGPLQRPGLGDRTWSTVDPGPMVAGGLAVGLVALAIALGRLAARQGMFRGPRIVLALGLVLWLLSLGNDLLFATGVLATMPLHGLGALALGVTIAIAVGPTAGETQPVRRTSADRPPAASAKASSLGLTTTWAEMTETDAKEHNRILVQALASAREAGEARRRFLAQVSHELRTPLHGILGMTELALDATPDPTRRRYLESAHRSAEELLVLVDDLLDLSRAESDSIALAIRSFSLQPFLEDTLTGVSRQAAEKGLALVLDTPDDLPVTMLGDPLRLRQVLLNLLGNAVKFTDKGEVRLRIRATSAMADRIGLRFEVADTGPGVPEEDRRRILEPFAQGEVGRGRGMGLGLAICVELLRRMGGQLELDCPPEGGCCFGFELPLGLRQQVEDPVQIDPIMLRGARLLLAEGDRATATELDAALASWQVQVSIVGDGERALRELDIGQREGRPYTVLLLDSALPRLDGWAVLDGVADRQDAPAVVMMLPADAPPADYARSVERGSVVAIGKPVRAGALHHALLQAIGAGPPTLRADPDTDDSVQPAGLRVLVADDRQVNLEVARAVLERLGCEVEVVRDGQAAVDAVVDGDFDLVLMDIGMPGMDGDEATGRIRVEEQRLGRVPVPIVALTAHAGPELRERLLAQGMDGVLTKPLRPVMLEELIENYRGSGAYAVVLPGDEPFLEIEDLVEEETVDSASAVSGGGLQPHHDQVDGDVTEPTVPGEPPPGGLPVVDPFHPDEDAADEDTEPVDDVVDLVRLDMLVAGDRGLRTELVQLFLDELPHYSRWLERGLRNRDPQDLAQFAHALTGAANNVALPELGQVARRLETVARASRLDLAEDVAQSLRVEINRARLALANLVGPPVRHGAR